MANLSELNPFPERDPYATSFPVNKVSSPAIEIRSSTNDAGRTTLDDSVTIWVSDRLKDIDNVTIYMFKAGTSGGFFSQPSESIFPDNGIPSEQYKGAKYFRFRIGDYFTEDDILEELRVRVDVVPQGQAKTGIPIEFNLDDELTTSNNHWEYVELDTPITIKAESDQAINAMRITRATGIHSSWQDNIADTDYFDVKIPDESVHNQTEFTFTIGDYRASFGRDLWFTINATSVPAEEIPLIEATYSESLVNLTSDKLDDMVIEGQDNLVTFSSTDDHHYISSLEIDLEYTNMEVNTVEVTLSERQKHITVDLSRYLEDDLLGIHMKGRADKLRTWLTYTTEEEAEDNPSFTATVINATVQNQSDMINDDDIIVITGNSGRVFNDPITLRIDYPDELIRGGTTAPTHETFTAYPDDPETAGYFSEDKGTVRIPVADFWKEEYYEFPPGRVTITQAVASQKKLTDGFVTNYANIFKRSRESLDEFTEALYSFDSNSYLDSVYNRVHSIYSMPFKLPDEMISEEPKDIITYNSGGTNVESPEARYILDNKYIVPLGTISVEGEYGNVYDFKDTQAYVHAPYVEQPILVDPSYVINEQVTLNVAIDLYNGNATLNIHSSKIQGELVQRNNIPIKHDIPMVSNSYNVIEGVVGGFVYNQVTTPFIEIVRNIPYESGSMFGKESNDYSQLKHFTGYIEVMTSHVNSTASETEQETIQTLLRQGVYINE